MGEAVIAPYPPNDGREWDCQCARCGSTVAMLAPWRCLSSQSWCWANPLPGREETERGALEWFVIPEAARG